MSSYLRIPVRPSSAVFFRQIPLIGFIPVHLLPDEIAVVWTAKGNVAKWAFLADRYAMLIFQSVALVGKSKCK